MRTKTFIKNLQTTTLMNLVDKIKKISNNIKEKQIFKLKYILNVCLLQFFNF